MASIKSLADGRADIYRFDPRVIQVEPGYNIRTFDSANDPDDAQLKASIKEHGVRTPLTIREEADVIYVVAGHRRLAAVMELIAEGVETLTTVVCLPEAKGTSEVDRIADLIRSNSGKALSDVERAVVIKRLQGHGQSNADIGRLLGLTSSQVNDLLTLGSASQEVKQLVETGVVAVSTAVRTIKEKGNRAATEALAEAVDKAKAEGRNKVKAKEVLKPRKPVGQRKQAEPVGSEIPRETRDDELNRMREELDEACRALEEIERTTTDLSSKRLARKGLGWDAHSGSAAA